MNAFSTRAVYIGIGEVLPNLLPHAVRGNALKLLSKVWIVVVGAQLKQPHVTVQSSQELRVLGAVQAKWTAERLLLSKHDIDVFEDIQTILCLAERAGLSQRIQLGEITGLYGILIGVAWSNDLLTSGQQVNLHIIIDLVTPKFGRIMT